MKAAKCIINNCLTVISGRGGTGKTEVVSAVLSAAEEAMKEDNQEIYIKIHEHTVVPVLYNVPAHSSMSSRDSCIQENFQTFFCRRLSNFTETSNLKKIVFFNSHFYGVPVPISSIIIFLLIFKNWNKIFFKSSVLAWIWILKSVRIPDHDNK
jgi:Cdc6-like AAA superfamily ATPase